MIEISEKTKLAAEQELLECQDTISDLPTSRRNAISSVSDTQLLQLTKQKYAKYEDAVQFFTEDVIMRLEKSDPNFARIFSGTQNVARIYDILVRSCETDEGKKIMLSIAEVADKIDDFTNQVIVSVLNKLGLEFNTISLQKQIAILIFNRTKKRSITS